MELNDLIPDKFRPLMNPKWLVKGQFLMFHHYENIPIAFIQNETVETVYVFLDARISKAVLKLVSFLVEKKIEFYFTTPQLSNPKGIIREDFKNDVVQHYLRSYSNKDFFYKFKDIDNFDFIQNMISWCKKEDCFDLIKNNYEIINKQINKVHYDYYANKSYYEYDEDIREEFRTLYRDIQIGLIL